MHLSRRLATLAGHALHNAHNRIARQALIALNRRALPRAGINRRQRAKTFAGK